MPSPGPHDPGDFLADHPVLFAMSVGSAFAASGYSLSRAWKASGRQRIGLALLGLLTAVEGVGIVVARNRAGT